MDARLCMAYRIATSSLEILCSIICIMISLYLHTVLHVLFNVNVKIKSYKLQAMFSNLKLAIVSISIHI